MPRFHDPLFCAVISASGDDEAVRRTDEEHARAISERRRTHSNVSLDSIIIDSLRERSLEVSAVILTVGKSVEVRR